MRSLEGVYVNSALRHICLACGHHALFYPRENTAPLLPSTDLGITSSSLDTRHRRVLQRWRHVTYVHIIGDCTGISNHV